MSPENRSVYDQLPEKGQYGLLIKNTFLEEAKKFAHNEGYQHINYNKRGSFSLEKKNKESPHIKTIRYWQVY